MARVFRLAVLGVLCFLAHAPANAQTGFQPGTLQLKIQGAGVTRVLDLSFTAGGEYFGSFTTNGISADVYGVIGGSGFEAYVGSDILTLTGIVTGDQTEYYGNSNSSTVRIQVSQKGNRLLYEGFVGTFDDLTGKSNSGKDRLVLYWGKSKLRLAEGPTPGSCVGSLTQDKIEYAVECATSGFLQDTFFNRSADVVLWIVFLLVR